MKKITKISLLLFISLLLVIPSWTTAFMQTGAQRYFPETGHYVEDEFLVFYQSIPNPEFIYGYPISKAFRDPTTGRLVQYFQRARFELHPENPAELRVELSPLGEFLHREAEPFPLTVNANVCRAFPETGFQVCYSFLRFFDAQGGVTQFGFPISSVEHQDGRFVQYFQRARFEWHPESAAVGQEVKLTNLGLLFFYENGEDTNQLIPDEDQNQLNNDVHILQLSVHAFPVKAVTSLNGTQSIYVIVQDQNLNPVPQTQVNLTVRFPTGKSASILLSPTNEAGIASGNIPFSPADENIGIVEIQVEAIYASLADSTLTSFRISK